MRTQTLLQISLFIGTLAFLPISCSPPPESEGDVSTIAFTLSEGPAALSLSGDSLFAAEPSASLIEKWTQHKEAYEADPNDPDKLIWLGRFTAYAGDYRGAIDLFGQGIEQFPEDPRFLRHRGHRYISIREFDQAIDDLEKAAELIAGTPNEIEPDGMPNPQNIPVSTLHGNIWYHLGLAYYLKQDMPNALRAYQNCLNSTQNDDNVVSSTHWLYMILRRMDRPEDAQEYLDAIEEEMNIIENFSYHNACLFYKGEISQEELVGDLGAAASNDAITYALGNWYQYNGEADKGQEILEGLLKNGSWNSFGYIAAEADKFNSQ